MVENTGWNYWKHFDKRVMDRYAEKGIIKESDIKSRLKALPDDTANAEWIELDVGDTEIADDGQDNEESKQASEDA
jgi:hypothetical protein